jgi:glycerate 2-kinase
VTDTLNARDDAEQIWRAAVEAVQPAKVIQAALQEPTISKALQNAKRIIVVGGGKAGAAMAAALEEGLVEHLNCVQGLVNVPAESVRPLKAVRLHAARPAASNHPTAEGVTGT